jgi:hypothetical protein
MGLQYGRHLMRRAVPADCVVATGLGRVGCEKSQQSEAQAAGHSQSQRLHVDLWLNMWLQELYCADKELPGMGTVLGCGFVTSS